MSDEENQVRSRPLAPSLHKCPDPLLSSPARLPRNPVLAAPLACPLPTTRSSPRPIRARSLTARALPQTVVLQTAGFDARFPNTNQSRHCFQAYVVRSRSAHCDPRPWHSHPPCSRHLQDYFRCVNAKGEDFPACKTVRSPASPRPTPLRS